MMRRLALLLTAMALVMAACGGDDDANEAQPNPDDAEFAEGLFDEIPRLPTSEEISERTERQGVVSQSYTVRGETPQGVMEWYSDTLVGEWTEVTPVTEIGVDSYRQRWSAQERVLTISSRPAPAADGDSRDQGQGVDVITQYSLSLSPEGEEADPGFTPGNDEEDDEG